MFFRSLLLVLFLITPVFAVYKIPADYLADMRQAKTAYHMHKTADTLFELAMTYAYSGVIEKGWGVLRRIPEHDVDYASKVLVKYGALAKEEPHEWRHFFKLAFGYYFQGNKEEAVVQFQTVLRLEPKQIWAMGFIALIKGEQGDYDAAIAWAKRALAIEPDASAIHFLLGEAYRKQGNTMGFLSALMTVGRLKTAEKFAYPDL